MPRPDSHECDVNIKASFQLIKTDSKRCPNCGVPITRISGCDHMFCTDCKIAFSWRTGEIHREGNTNPHYLQWQAHQHLTAAPRPGQGLPTACMTLTQRLTVIYSRLLGDLWSPRHFYPQSHDFWIRDNFNSIQHGISHFEQMHIRNQRLEIREGDFLKLRVRFLRHQIDEHEWRCQIQRLDKRNRLNQGIVDVFSLFTQGSVDILETILVDDSLVSFIPTRLEELRTLCNKELANLVVIYGCNSFMITKKRQLTIIGTQGVSSIITDEA